MAGLKVSPPQPRNERLGTWWSGRAGGVKEVNGLGEHS